MTNQSDLQQSIRAITSTTLNYEGDWHALFDSASIPAGTYNERLLAWINAQLSSSYTEINGAKAAYAENRASGGGTPWQLQLKADGVDPTLALQFDRQRYAANNATKSFADILTATRSTTGTYFDASGVMREAAINEMRFDHDPVTGESLGLLLEGARTNLVLNSATGSAQSITVTAVAHTLSFYGTGTVTLSGVYSGSLVGSGAYPERSTLTFTPTAGSLTISVTGTIQFIQIEAGSFPSSYIPTTSGAVTRAADVVLNNASNTVPFASWYNQSEGAVVVDFDMLTTTSGVFPILVSIDNGVTNEMISVQQRNTSVGIKYEGVDGGVSQASINVTDSLVGRRKLAVVAKLNDFAISINASVPSTDTNGTMPTPTRISIGFGAGGISMHGHIRALYYYPVRVSNAELQRITT